MLPVARFHPITGVQDKASCPQTAPVWKGSVFKKCAPVCDNCYASKYGCDRRRPCCSNCARRNLTCTYSARPCGRPSNNPVRNAVRVAAALQMDQLVPPAVRAKGATHRVGRLLTPQQRARLTDRKKAARQLNTILVNRKMAGPVNATVKRNAAVINTVLRKVCTKRAKRALPPRRLPTSLLDVEGYERLLLEPPRRRQIIPMPKHAKRMVPSEETFEGVLHEIPLAPPTWTDVELAYVENQSIEINDVLMHDRNGMLVALIQLVADNTDLAFTPTRMHIVDVILFLANRDKLVAHVDDINWLRTYLQQFNIPSRFGALYPFVNG